MIKRFVKRTVTTFVLYKLMKWMDMESPMRNNRVVKTSYKAMLKRIK